MRASGGLVVDRDELFIETTVLDLLILHQPIPTPFETTIAAYEALETLLADGNVRAIGVSNSMPHHIDRLLREIDVVPARGAHERRSVMQDATIAELARDHGKSPAQIMLRWGIQESRSVIPKSTNPTRIAENFDVFDFELTAEEMGRVDGLDTGVRSGPDPVLPPRRSVRPRDPLSVTRAGKGESPRPFERKWPRTPGPFRS